MPEELADPVDVLIVGAGPTGLYAAYYAGFRGLTVAVVDALPEPGGQVTAMYPEKLIYDVAGFPVVRGRDLVAGLVEQAGQYKPGYLLGRVVTELIETADGFRLEFADGPPVAARSVLVTAGLGEFRPRPLPAGQGWLGRGLEYFVPRPGDHAGRDVVVVGGGDAAFDWALTLHPIARSVTLVHRRSRFRAHRSVIDAMAELPIPVLTDTEVALLRGTDRCEEVVLRDRLGATRVLPAQSVIAALGFTADLGSVQAWGLELDRRAVRVDSRMATNRYRIFAAGDIATYPGKVRLIATGFGEAATAVNNIATVLDPSAHLFPGHSTDTID